MFGVWYQSCDPMEASPSSAQVTSLRTLWYLENETACQNRCFAGLILMTILLIFAGPAQLVLNIGIDLLSLQFIGGWYQKSHGVACTWTMPLIMGLNWLVLVDAYSKYPCVHLT